MKNQIKKLRWALLVPVFTLVLSFFSTLILPGTQVYAADCSSLYPNTNSNEYKACKDGFDNANTTNYCDRRKNTAAYDKCLEGYQLANGQAVSTPTPATSQDCKKQYGPGGLTPNDYDLRSCNEAYNNATDNTYCNRYNGTKAYDACYVGQMSKLGQSVSPPGQANSSIYTASGVDGWCSGQYSSDANAIRACQEGAKNMGVKDYCDKYQGKSAYGPCKAGWDYAHQWAKDNGVAITDTTSSSGTNVGDTTCVVPYVGWAVCPILLAVSKGVDAAYDVVEGILETPVSIFTESGTNGIGEVYGKFLNVGNIALALAFLAVIIAQAIPGFLPNYTIKKYMPKLMIAAVVLNLAFYACAAMVDVVNIVGKSIPDFFNSMTAQNVIQNIPNDWTVPVIGAGPTGNANGFGDFTGSILAGAAVIGGIQIFSASGLAPIGWAILMFLIPIVLGAIVAILAILLALVLRSALIIILIVISPLAFAALSLPNTEGLFKKWWGLFSKLLLLYPIVALVFGGSKLAGSILMNVATVSSGSVVGAFLAMAASAATILPLILVPGIMKGAISATGKLGQKIEGMADKGFAGAKSVTDKRMRESAPGTYFAEKGKTRQTLRRAGVSRRETRQALRSTNFGQARAMAGYGALDKASTDELNNMTAYLHSYRDAAGNELGNGTYEGIINGTVNSVGGVAVNDTMRIAAWQHAKASFGGGDMVRMSQFASSPAGHRQSQSVRNAMFDAMIKNNKTPQIFGAHVGTLKNGSFDHEAAIRDYVATQLNNETMLENSTAFFSEANNIARRNGDVAMLTALQTAVTQVRADAYYNGRINNEQNRTFNDIMA